MYNTPQIIVHFIIVNDSLYLFSQNKYAAFPSISVDDKTADITNIRTIIPNPKYGVPSTGILFSRKLKNTDRKIM